MKSDTNTVCVVVKHGVLVANPAQTNTLTALPEHVELVALVLGVGSEELGDEKVHVIADPTLVVVVVGIGAVRESDARRLVDPQYVGRIRPRVGVVYLLKALDATLDAARAVLVQERQHARATRPARHPEDEGGVSGSDAGLEHPVEVIFVDGSWGIELVISRVLNDRGVAESVGGAHGVGALVEVSVAALSGVGGGGSSGGGVGGVGASCGDVEREGGGGGEGLHVGRGVWSVYWYTIALKI